ncbi:MAG: hypothetical protein PUP91_17725 [Rhizonema sp. PD37]|nr:hypothetical protein [Rhizonema sp. PD37]
MASFSKCFNAKLGVKSRYYYYFWLYALDTELDLKPGLTREQLIEAIADHVIEQARLVGVYER